MSSKDYKAFRFITVHTKPKRSHYHSKTILKYSLDNQKHYNTLQSYLLLTLGVMTSRAKLPAIPNKAKQPKKKVKTKPIYKNNNDLAEKMSKYFLVSN